jgi:hypothetical protein
MAYFFPGQEIITPVQQHYFSDAQSAQLVIVVHKSLPFKFISIMMSRPDKHMSNTESDARLANETILHRDLTQNEAVSQSRVL